MMKIIVLYGKGNTGKSTSIRRFYEKYVKDNPLFAINKDDIGTLDLRLRATYKGKIVGIFSHGDSEWWVKDGFDYVGECDVVICACRSKGAAMDYIKSKSSGIIWLEKATLGYVGGVLLDGDAGWIREEQADSTAARINSLLQMLM